MRATPDRRALAGMNEAQREAFLTTFHEMADHHANPYGGVPQSVHTEAHRAGLMAAGAAGATPAPAVRPAARPKPAPVAAPMESTTEWAARLAREYVERNPEPQPRRPTPKQPAPAPASRVFGSGCTTLTLEPPQADDVKILDVQDLERGERPAKPKKGARR